MYLRNPVKLRSFVNRLRDTVFSRASEEARKLLNTLHVSFVYVLSAKPYSSVVHCIASQALPQLFGSGIILPLLHCIFF